MKKFIAVLSMVAFVGVVAGCSSERRTKTTTSETIESAPADPVTTQKKTVIHSETRTSD